MPAYVAWRAGRTNRVVVRAELVPGLLKGLQICPLLSRYSTAHLKVRCQLPPPPCDCDCVEFSKIFVTSGMHAADFLLVSLLLLAFIQNENALWKFIVSYIAVTFLHNTVCMICIVGTYNMFIIYVSFS